LQPIANAQFRFTEREAARIVRQVRDRIGMLQPLQERAAHVFFMRPVFQILTAVKLMHELGYVHRDLK
jgi:serine/threonine protein kinase